MTLTTIPNRRKIKSRKMKLFRRWLFVACICGLLNRQRQYLVQSGIQSFVAVQNHDPITADGNEPSSFAENNTTRVRYRERQNTNTTKRTSKAKTITSRHGREAVNKDVPLMLMNSFLTSMNLTRDDLYERNFFYRAWMTNLESESTDATDFDSTLRKNHLPPMAVMTRYISQHSHQRLELEWNEACGQGQQQQQQREGIAPADDSLSCRLDSTKSSRRYLVASYSCPIESGNRLHRFMNGVLWAVLTNRTFLWRYQDYDVCEEYDEGNCASEYNRSLIVGPVDCEGLIQRSPWIPSYEDWRDKLGFEADRSDLVKAEVSHKISKIEHDSGSYPYDGFSVKRKPTGGDLGSNGTTNNSSISIIVVNTTGIEESFNNDDIRLIRTGKQITLNPGAILTTSPAKNKFLTKAKNLQRLELIRSEGIYFLYGMLFESLFTMDPSLDPPKDLLHSTFSEEARSIFIHSRHPGNKMVNNTYPERFCLKRMLNATAATTDNNDTDGSTKSTNPRPCHVYIMSDRPVTVDLLHKQVRNSTHCTSSSRSQVPPSIADGSGRSHGAGANASVSNTETATSVSFRSEHGPRAGRGYWEDIALTTHARNGMIAFSVNSRPFNLVRTSTALIREIVDFRRFLEDYYNDVFVSGNDHNKTDDPDHPGFFECQHIGTKKDKKRNHSRRRGEKEKAKGIKKAGKHRGGT